ncbi:MAG: transposase zinc-binding domain-containing protein [Acidobacteriota bacterium]|nr:transposase zinc-binding domain-containing protein [Acidobacteriota bacterium]
MTFFQRAPGPKIAFYRGYLSASLHPGPFLESFLAVMAGVYHQRHPERTVFFHYFEKFLLEYEKRFEREYGYLRPVIQEVVNKYLDCGNPKCGFARIRCPECGTERLLTFSCKVRGFCPSCHAKRREEWGEWMHSKVRAKGKQEAERVGKYMIRPILSLKRLFLDEAQGQLIYQYGKHSTESEHMDYLEFIARVSSHIPEKGQVLVRYYGLYANAHRGKINKAGVSPSYPPIIEEEERGEYF